MNIGVLWSGNVQHKWKAKTSLEQLWNIACEDVEDGIFG